MRESWVSPVTGAREPAPAWHAVWRFRVVALLVLTVVVVLAAVGYKALTGEFADTKVDPGIPRAAAQAQASPAAPVIVHA